MAKLSVIIPCYNMGKYILDALKSLEEQTYKDFDVIIIDDGSNDESRDVIEDFKCHSSLTIHYYYQDNAGVSAARNTAIEKSSSEYLFFLDADDTLPTFTLSILMSDANKYDVSAGYVLKGVSCDKKNYNRKNGIENLMNEYLFNNIWYQFCSFLYKKEIVDLYSLRFSEDLKYGEDEEFAWKYLCHCKTAVINCLNIYNYRDNPTSASHNVSFLRTQCIDTMMRAANYFDSFHNPFGWQLKNMGVPRAKLAILKQFAMCGQYNLYKQLRNSDKYNMSLFSLLKFPDLKIRIAAFVYCISPSLFYKLFYSLLSK